MWRKKVSRKEWGKHVIRAEVEKYDLSGSNNLAGDYKIQSKSKERIMFLGCGCSEHRAARKKNKMTCHSSLLSCLDESTFVV
jgi:hypothetical protein